MATPYTTAAEANAYFLGVGTPTAWTEATPAEQVFALQNAADWIDRTYGARWVGDRITRAQERDWPRDNAQGSRDGFDIANTGFPFEVKNASIEAAARYLVDPTMTDGDVTDRGISSESVAADPTAGVTESIHYVGSKPERQKAFPVIDGILANILTAGTGAGIGTVTLG